MQSGTADLNMSIELGLCAGQVIIHVRQKARKKAIIMKQNQLHNLEATNLWHLVRFQSVCFEHRAFCG